MSDREKLARQWAEDAKDFPNAEYTVETEAAIEHILATTTPSTMADVEWDDEEHYLAGATCEIAHSERVMLAPRDGAIVNVPLEGDRVSLTSPGALTPNGKRYELREVGKSEPDHPEVLTIEEDYQNAPRGTVIADCGHFPAIKISDRSWAVRDSLLTSEKLADTYSRLAVLRWGWGDAA